ncbi:response regulator [bacterium]|nr:response regulator [bacterium]
MDGSENGGNHRVLIVDDNRSARLMLSKLLSAIGDYEIEVVGSGMEALELLPKFDPAIVLLDIGLPMMDGYEVARRIRAEFPHEKILLVAVTGYSRDEHPEQAEAAGFDLHLVKPIGVEQLRSLMEHAKLQ